MSIIWWARPAATAKSQPALLPELLNRVIEIAKGDYDARDKEFQSFLAQISLVCRMWAEETRPFIFKSVELAFGSKQERSSNSDSTNPGGEQPLAALRQRAQSLIQQALGSSQSTVPRALRRVERFLILTRCNPQIATSVRHLQLFAAERNATDELNASADVLLEIFSTLSNIRSVKVTMLPQTRHARQDWWYNRLEDTARSAITFLLSRPTLEALTLEVSTIPCAIWDPHPLKFVKMLESLCKSTLEGTTSGPISDFPEISHELGRITNPNLSRVNILPETFGHLSHLVLYENLSCAEDINKILLRSRQTLTTLRLHLKVNHVKGQTSRVPLPILDFSHMEKLHTFAFQPPYHGLSSEEVSSYIFQTLDTLPWAQITVLCVAFVLKCPDSTHSPFNPQDYCNSLDSLISRRAMLPPHSNVAGTAKARLQYVVSTLDLQMCNTCLQFFAVSVPSSIWQIQDLFPLLHSAIKREELGMAVESKWSDSQKSHRHHYRSVPPQIQEVAEYLKKVLK